MVLVLTSNDVFISFRILYIISQLNYPLEFFLFHCPTFSHRRKYLIVIDSEINLFCWA